MVTVNQHTEVKDCMRKAPSRQCVGNRFRATSPENEGNEQRQVMQTHDLPSACRPIHPGQAPSCEWRNHTQPQILPNRSFPGRENEKMKNSAPANNKINICIETCHFVNKLFTSCKAAFFNLIATCTEEEGQSWSTQTCCGDRRTAGNDDTERRASLLVPAAHCVTNCLRCA